MAVLKLTNSPAYYCLTINWARYITKFISSIKIDGETPCKNNSLPKSVQENYRDLGVHAMWDVACVRQNFASLCFRKYVVKWGNTSPDLLLAAYPVALHTAGSPPSYWTVFEYKKSSALSHCFLYILFSQNGLNICATVALIQIRM